MTEPTPDDIERDDAARERFEAATYPCPFRVFAGERPLADQLHSHAASMSYVLYDPSAEQDSPLELVRSGDYLLDLAQRVMQDAVDRAREAGCTWQEIGAQLRITRQAAQMRFGRKK